MASSSCSAEITFLHKECKLVAERLNQNRIPYQNLTEETKFNSKGNIQEKKSIVNLKNVKSKDLINMYNAITDNEKNIKNIKLPLIQYQNEYLNNTQ